MNFPNEVSLAEAGANLDLTLFADEEGPGIARAVGSYRFPVDADAQYRGWYRITSGADAGRALWAPKWSKYQGPRPSGPHGGSDLFGESGTNVLALTGGTIEWRPVHPDWGNHIYLYHRIAGVRHIAVHAHLDPSGAFPAPKSVAGGDVIGKVGCTGNAGNNGACWRDATCNGKTSIEDHLHLELLVLDEAGTVTGKKDAVATYGWSVAYENDASQTICGSTAQQLP
ncbi:M23 family metallopeptidase [Acuticoccus sp. I52.16.1]|uniref:M23 family metallopeptidase n=1 Tax=Acuticoccus sp. I52.16.1 TaxID=2928472 RepID=UPI001FD23C36|nr:M23 family metallopeptidase [Acuticoccus sp. I52.16.1]UOM36745.1 M23 family metallopeptidase [Acuticoccus sp. I52.16.1]